MDIINQIKKYLNIKKNPKLAFIVGPPRSGTTWMWGLLSSHPDIIPLVREDFGGEPSVMDGRRITSETGAFVNYDNNFIKHVVQKKAADNPDKLLIEKTPLHALKIDRIFKAFPQAKVIFMIRDPRAIISSTMKAEFCQLPRTVDEAIDYYRRFHKAMKKAERYSLREKLMFVRYENLILDTKGEISRVLSFLDINCMDELCDEIIRDNHKKSKVALKGVFRKGTVNSYKDDLSPYDIAKIEKNLYDELRILNYL